MRRVTLRAATQPPLGGELPPTAVTARTMSEAVGARRRVPITVFWGRFVILRGAGGLHSYFSISRSSFGLCEVEESPAFILEQATRGRGEGHVVICKTRAILLENLRGGGGLQS